ncbi:SLATT domain-containing protein [Pseudoalteromonas sp. CAL260-MNA-CIBAN-0059]|uniref:SLATT domain-containing protein n=1 Tax=unclassified Pseudoalteromonas TaxID=194690 RepID=UPI00331B221F|tara:strand:- start:1484 stop:2104 length:621 start_codon:yes stop_codon:yes gene_type:complete
MDINNLKKHIAETAYNVGYSAKLHFASYEIIERLPGLISFFSMAFGIYALAFSNLSTKFMSCTLLVLGLIGLYVSLKNSDKEAYEEKGIALTGLFNELKHLMSDAKSQTSNITSIANKLNDIEGRYNNSCASSHIMFATWFAHYKFFWEQQIAWIDDQRKFSFFRDKIPLTFWVSLIVVAIIFLLNTESIMIYICEFTQVKEATHE